MFYASRHGYEFVGKRVPSRYRAMAWRWFKRVVVVRCIGTTIRLWRSAAAGRLEKDSTNRFTSKCHRASGVKE